MVLTVAPTIVEVYVYCLQRYCIRRVNIFEMYAIDIFMLPSTMPNLYDDYKQLEGKHEVVPLFLPLFVIVRI